MMELGRFHVIFARGIVVGRTADGAGLCFRQTVCSLGLLLLQGGCFDLFVLLRMVQRGIADEFLCGGGRTQRGGTVVVIMCDMVVGFDAEAVAVEVAHDFQGFGMVFLGGGFGVACRLERVSFGKFAGQGVLGQLGLSFRLFLVGGTTIPFQGFGSALGGKKVGQQGLCGDVAGLRGLFEVLFGLCVVGADTCAVEVDLTELPTGGSHAEGGRFFVLFDGCRKVALALMMACQMVIRGRGISGGGKLRPVE